jgi:hypothetical protein
LRCRNNDADIRPCSLDRPVNCGFGGTINRGFRGTDRCGDTSSDRIWRGSDNHGRSYRDSCR